MARFILGMLLFVVPLVGSQRNVETEAQTIWEKVLDAKGGKERLHSVQSVLRSTRVPSRVRSRSFDRQIEELFVLPSQYWSWADERPTLYGINSFTLDFETRRRYFIWDTDSAPRISVADPKVEGWRFDLMQAVELLETRWMRLTPVRTWSEKAGKTTSLLVQCKFQTPNGWATATFTLDSKTFLPVRATVTRPLSLDALAKHEFEFLDYVDVIGIKMPTLIHYVDTALKYDQKLRYQFNVDYNPVLFERGPRIEDGLEGWRRH